MKFAPLALLGALAAAASPAWSACFTIYDAKNSPVYQSTQPPIDLSQSISEQMTRRYPQHFLVVSDETSCNEVNNTNSYTRSALPGLQRLPYATPLLRDAQDAMGN